LHIVRRAIGGLILSRRVTKLSVIIDKPQLLFELNYPLFNVFERFFVANYQGNLQVRCKLGFDFCALIIHPDKNRPTAEKFQTVGWSVSDKVIVGFY